jgi:hypothetical protein
VFEKPGPADAPEGKGQIDAAGAKSYFDPISMSKLGAKEAEVEVNPLSAPNHKRNYGNKYNQTKNQLIFLQAFSVSRLSI